MRICFFYLNKSYLLIWIVYFQFKLEKKFLNDFSTEKVILINSGLQKAHDQNFLKVFELGQQVKLKDPNHMIK